jgi:primosomal replication protein N''
MMRFCPNCQTERRINEVFCEGRVGDVFCDWDLTSLPIREPGWRPFNLEARPEPAAPVSLACRNGHALSPGDIICPVCGADAASESPVPSNSAEPAEPAGPEHQFEPEEREGTIVHGWRLLRRLPASSAVRERFIAIREGDNHQVVLTLYSEGAEPDPAVYDVLRTLPRDHVPALIETGRWQDHAYEVSEELTGGTLADIGLVAGDLDTVRRIVEEIGRALHVFSQAGLRHRDLRPGTLLVRRRDPLDLVVTGFGSARLSDFDLDIVSPLETTRYTAPEAVAGGVAAASDWWSLGMILLEQITAGACFEGTNEQAFLIHVLTHGVMLPPDLDPSIELLLRGLLARDRRQRWQWTEARAWLDGEPVSAPPTEGSSGEAPASESIGLAGHSHRTPAAFALAAAQQAHWDEARDHLLRGVVANWVAEASLEPRIQAGIRQLAHIEGLSDDGRLAVALKVLHPSMPLVVRGEIVTPGWLLAHPGDGYDLVTGPAPDLLRRLDQEEIWLSRLKTRAETVRARARQLDVALNEDELRIHLLSTSKARLIALWEERRRLLPDTEHPGLVSLIERRQTTDEDLILLLAASVAQFRSVGEIVEEAEESARRAGVAMFSRTTAETFLTLTRRDLYRQVEERIQGFARCGNGQVDEWADQFRLERRMPLGRAAALLCVPEQDWRQPPRQAYVSTILDYFAKKVAGAVLRGPLARMTIGKWTPRVDVTELGSERRPAQALLDQILARTDLGVDVDPTVFAGPDTLERRLRSLHAHATLYRRDTGIDGLYLGFPFLLIRDPRGNTRTRIAPVLLWPVRINPQVGNRGHVSVGFDRDRDEVRLNPAFEGLMGMDASRRWQEIAHELLGRASVTAADVMDAFGTLAIAQSRDLTRLPGRDVTVPLYEPELACAGVFFHLAYMGQAIVEDLRHLKAIPPAGTGLESMLRVSAPLPERAKASPVPEHDRYFTVASDPSQEAAVLEARHAPGLLIEGPPGTGKSQTIVNMVADAIGRNKTLLIVCQKQAALEVVRKRLAAEGLEQRMVMVTDVNHDREPVVRAVREQVEALLSRPPGGAPSWKRERDALAARIEALEGDLDRHHAALHHVDGQTGLTYRNLLGELVDLQGSRRPPMDAPALRGLLGGLDPARVAALEENCAPLIRYWLPAKFEGSALAALQPFAPDEVLLNDFRASFEIFVRAETERSRVVADTHDAFDIDDPDPCRDWLARHAAVFRRLDDETRDALARWVNLFRASTRGSSPGADIVRNLDALVGDLAGTRDDGYDPRVSAVCTPLSDAELQHVALLAASVLTPASLLGAFSPGRWLRRRRVRRFLEERGMGTSRDEIGAFLAAARHEQARRPYQHRINALLSMLDSAPRLPDGATLAALRTVGHTLLQRLENVAQLAALLADYPRSVDIETAIRVGTAESFETFAARAGRAFERFDARKASLTALARLSAWFDDDWIGARRAAIETDVANAEALSAISAALPTLAAYLTFQLRASRLGDAERKVLDALRGMATELEALPVGELDGEVRRTLAREARFAWKARLEMAEPVLLYERDEIDSKVTALAEADRRIRELNRLLLVQGIDLSRLRHWREWEDITRLRGQRARRLREVIDRGAELGLMAVRPVWLMNPDVASRVLPLKSGMFDVVIYDEASQMPVEYALPSLFRGAVVIVSGDEKQMPPTAFFSSKVENDEADVFEDDEPEDDASEEERGAYEETWNRREIKDCPDLLQLARSVLPTTMLQVHYRSAYRELISFSNASFYGDRLSVPVRHPDTEIRRARPIEIVRVNGVYQEQTNRAEAEKVAELLARFWKEPAPKRPSIGVVSFNRKQADLIEEVLEERAEADAAFGEALSRERERLEDGEDMGFFVKNVENVQGDERDVVIFSSTFGCNAQGTFRRNFGVLGQNGGERRLNVAVTRARHKIIIVTSMPIGDISDFLHTRRAPVTPRDYLQAYLEYARTMSEGEIESGRGLLARFASKTSPLHERCPADIDGFGRAVTAYLRDLGFEAVPAHDGGAFGLDFAIEDPRTGVYGIGIECDAPRHRILETARAREIWRPRVLSRAVSVVHRVSLRGWFGTPDDEQRRLREAVDRALA